jgi:hypothetical protein
LKFYGLGFARNVLVTCYIWPLAFSGAGWACGVIGTRNGGHCRHIRALESPESSEFTIQSGALIEKVRFLSRRPDICIFNLKSNFASGDWLSATPQMMKMRNKQLTGSLVNPVPLRQMRWC